MQVRVFESTDMASGLKMVKKELGPDALILSTKTVRNGKLGLLGKPMFEITAAIDTVDTPEMSRSGQPYKSKEAAPVFTMEPKTTGANEKRRSNGNFSRIVDDSLEQYLTNVRSNPSVVQEELINSTQVPADAAQNGLQNEVNELKELVKGLAGQITQLSGQQHNLNHNSRPTPTSPVSATDGGHGAATMFHDNIVVASLTARGVNLSTSRHIAGILQQSFADSELNEPARARKEIIKTIEKLIAVEPPEWHNREKQQRMALVGPTGVGKTTTLAKLAAAYLSNHSKSIALITIDTYRIAAVEQLKVYGEIMRLPVEVVISPEQLDNVLEKHSDKDLILIDTAGRSPKDHLCIDELASFLRPELAIDKHLVVSAATRENELLDIISRFGTLDISNTIFTKLDECMNLGVLLNVQTQNASPLSYVTNGQRVPEDLLEISPQIIAELIMSQHEGSTDD